jgi:hypothetical protein
MEIVGAAVFAGGAFACVELAHLDPYAVRIECGIDACVLIAPQGLAVSVNGRPVRHGIRVLENRDAIRVAGFRPTYYSTERLPEVVAFPGTAVSYCARCKLAIEPGHAAVCCPGCGVWHHEQTEADAESRQCWSYAPRCSVCDQTTDLSGADERWTPERL